MSLKLNGINVVWFLTFSLFWLPLNGSLYERVGCFNDHESNRALPYDGKGKNNRWHSVDSCYVRCGESKVGKKYFGLEWRVAGRQCFCGDSLKLAKKFGSASCGELGDKDKLSIFEVKEIPAMTRKGAYRDKKGDRAMTFQKKYNEKQHYQRGRCYTRCRRRGYKFFALQNKRECYCSHSFAKSTRYGTDECGEGGGALCNYIWEIDIENLKRCVISNILLADAHEVSAEQDLDNTPAENAKIDNTCESCTTTQTAKTREVSRTEVFTSTTELTASFGFTLSAQVKGKVSAFGNEVEITAGFETRFDSSVSHKIAQQESDKVTAPAQTLVVPPGKCLQLYVYYTSRDVDVNFTYDIVCEDGTKSTAQTGSKRTKIFGSAHHVIECDAKPPKLVKVAFIGISSIVLLSGLLYGLRRRNKYNDNYEILETTLKENDLV